MGGIPPGLFGEFYIEFGVFGTLLLAALFGMFFSQLHRLFLYAYTNDKLIPFVAIITPFICFNLIRGGMDVGFTRIAIYSFSFFMIVSIYKFGIRPHSNNKISRLTQ